jgi:hypothetical protein
VFVFAHEPEPEGDGAGEGTGSSVLCEGEMRVVRMGEVRVEVGEMALRAHAWRQDEVMGERGNHDRLCLRSCLHTSPSQRVMAPAGNWEWCTV